MPDTYEIRSKLDALKPWQRKAVIYNTGGIQLTEVGTCSIGCKGCGCGAIRTSPEHIPMFPWDYFKELVDQYKSVFIPNAVRLSGFGNEPFDYDSQGKGYRDAYNYLYDGETPHMIKTGVPRGKEDEVIASLDIISQITLTEQNFQRLYGIIQRIEEAYPQYKHVLQATEWFPLGPENMDNLYPFGLGCFHGVMLTPTEIYSVRTVKTSKDSLYGNDMTPIPPKNFSIQALCWSPLAGITEDVPEAILNDLYMQFLNLSYTIDLEDKILHPIIANLLASKFTDITCSFDSTGLLQSIEGYEAVTKLVKDKSSRSGSRGLNDFERKILADAESLLDKWKSGKHM